jgi:hypothetical protein
MLIDWLKLTGALVLLLPPIAVFERKNVRYRAVMRDWNGYWGRTLSHGLHWVDFLRAALGAWLLVEALPVSAEARGAARHVPLLFQVAV